MASTAKIDITGNDQLSRIAKKAGRAMKGFKGEVGRAGDAMVKFNKTSKKTHTGMKALGKLKGVLTVAAVAAVATKGLSAAATAETAALKVLSNVTSVAEKDRLRPIIQAALEDAGKLGIPMNEAGDALFTMTSQMGTADKVFKQFRGSMKLSVGGFANFQSSVSVTNKLMEQFGDLGGDAEKTARQIFQAQVLGDTDVNALALALPTAAGAAKTAGLKSAEFLSLISASSKRTKNTAGSAESLKALISSFQNVTAGGDREKAFAELGIAPGTENLQKQGLVNILQQIVSKRGTEGGQALIDRAFTGDGAKTFLNNVDQGMVDAIVSGTKKIEEGSALDLSFNDVSKSIAVEQGKLASAMDKAMATVGTQMVPALQSLTDGIELAQQEAEAGNSFIFHAIGNSLASLTNNLTGNVQAMEDYRAERRRDLGIAVTLDNNTDTPASVKTSGADTGVQTRGG